MCTHAVLDLYDPVLRPHGLGLGHINLIQDSFRDITYTYTTAKLGHFLENISIFKKSAHHFLEKNYPGRARYKVKNTGYACTAWPAICTKKEVLVLTH